MQNSKIKVASAALVLLVASALSPVALADTSVQISGNGSRSDNSVSMDWTKVLNISQTNDADINNNVRIDANTGDNTIRGNTGGDTNIETGSVDSNIEISNAANSNVLKLGSCGCEQGDLNVKISGNGYNSDNQIDLSKTDVTEVNQENNSDINNDVRVNADTGGNDVRNNTGGGESYNHDNYMKNNYDKDYNHMSDSYKHDNYQPKYTDYSHKNSNNNYSNWNKNMHQGMNNWWNDFMNNHNQNHHNNNYGNNGGDVSIETGDVVTDLMIHNLANHNFLSF